MHDGDGDGAGGRIAGAGAGPRPGPTRTAGAAGPLLPAGPTRTRASVDGDHRVSRARGKALRGCRLVVANWQGQAGRAKEGN